MAETDDFINNLKEINQELQVFSRAINSTSRVIDIQEQQAAATGRQTRATNDQTAAAQRNAAAERALADTTNQLNSGFKLLKDVLGKAVSVGGRFADTILDVSEKTTKLTAAMNSAAVAAAEIAAQFGRIGKTLGFFISVTASRLEQQFEFIQASLDAKDSLAKFGANVSMTTDELITLTLEAGRTMAEFEKIGKPLSSLNIGILALGTTASEGAKAFIKIADVEPEVRNKMRKLGISFEELTQGQADYIVAMSKGGRIFSQNELEQGKVRNASLRYLETLQALADITGKSVDQAKEEYAQVQGTIQMSIINNQLTVKRKDLELQQQEAIRAGDTVRAESLKKQIEFTQRQQDSFKTLGEVFQKSGNADIAGALQSFFTTGQMAPDMVQRFAGVDLAKYKSQFEKGTFDESAFLKEYFANAQNRATMFGTGALLAENIGEYLKALGLSQEIINRLTRVSESGGVEAYDEEMKKAVQARTQDQLEADRFTDRRNVVLEDQLASRIKQEQDLYQTIDNGLRVWQGLTQVGTAVTDVLSGFMTVMDRLFDKILDITGFGGSAAPAGGSVAAIGSMAAGSTVIGGAGAAGVGGNAGLPVTGVGAVQMGRQVRVGDEIRKGGTVSWRTNNPGNISYGDLAKSHGAIGAWKNPDGDVQQRTTGIAIFPTMEHGYNAMMSLWRHPMYRNLTIDEGVSMWTKGDPRVNLGTGYATDMARAAGVSVNTIIGQLSDQQLTAMTNKQKVWEGFKEGQILKADKGGHFLGPSTGYPVEMHRGEIVAPLNPNSILAELGQKTTEQFNAESKGVQTSMVESMKDMSVSNKVFMDMISTKLDTMISKLDAGNDTRTKILRHTYT